MNCVGLPWFRRGLGPVLWASAVGAWGGVCWFRFRVADLAFRVELRVGTPESSREPQKRFSDFRRLETDLHEL